MSDLGQTPSGNRIRIAFFGLRNAGKSTLVNAFTSQNIAIVSDVAGTTTDPVSKAMEIPPLGPCIVTDTAGLDDSGELGEMRVKKSLDILAVSDIAVWVDGGVPGGVHETRLKEECKRRGIRLLTYHRGDSVEGLKRKIAEMDIGDVEPSLLEGLVSAGDKVVCICPIDSSAPKGRLILPQVQVVRACLDAHAVCTVCQVEDIPDGDYDLAITDSQAFARVKGRFARLTSFSVLFARQKGRLDVFAEGLGAVADLCDGAEVLVVEGCTHHRQCEDIGTVKIPAALKKLSSKNLKLRYVSGNSFPDDLSGVSLVVHCGGCMLTRREMLRRIEIAQSWKVPMVNYGLLLAAAAGIAVEDIKNFS